MNKTYRVVRNSAGEWVVASELAKGHRKSAGGKALACSSALALLLAMPPVSAADYTVTNANDITKTTSGAVLTLGGLATDDNLTVTNTGKLTTTATGDAMAIQARPAGTAVLGNVSITNSGALDTAGTSGQSVGSAIDAIGNSVAIDNTGAITTSNGQYKAAAIRAESVGAGGVGLTSHADITGPARGLWLRSTGAGAINATVSGKLITGTGANNYGNAIVLESNGDATVRFESGSIASGSAATSNSDAIRVSADEANSTASVFTGAGTVIKTFGAASNSTAAGIRATSNLGKVSVISNSTITTQGDQGRGIWAQAGVYSNQAWSGGGDVSVESHGDIATLEPSTNEAQSDAIYAWSPDGNVTVKADGNLGTADFRSDGIDAASIGGKTDVTFASGSIKTTGDASNAINAASEKGAVKVVASGLLSTAGATQSSAIFAHTGQPGAAASFTDNPAGDAEVTFTRGEITTSGVESSGLYVMAMGATGNAIVDNSGKITATGKNSSGISARTKAGNVTIKNAGQLSTSGDSDLATGWGYSNSAAAIFGGTALGGAVDIENSGDIVTRGAGSHGIYSLSAPDPRLGSLVPATGAVHVDNTGAITVDGIADANGGVHGIFADNRVGGDATVTGSGNIAITNVDNVIGDAVLVHTLAAGTASVDYSGTITTQAEDAAGLRVFARGTGDAIVNYTGPRIEVAGHNADAIYAYSKEGGTRVTAQGELITHANHGTGGVAFGIAALSGGGAVDATFTGSKIEVDGSSAAILAMSNYDTADRKGTGQGAVTVNNAGELISHAASGRGIDARSTTGNQSITNSGAITVEGDSSHGIVARATDGVIEIANSAQISAAGKASHGVRAATNSQATISNEVAGQIHGGSVDGAGVVIGGTTQRVVNAGRIDALSERALVADGNGVTGTATLTNASTGTITGAVAATASTTTMDNAGQWNLRHFADTDGDGTRETYGVAISNFGTSGANTVNNTGALALLSHDGTATVLNPAGQYLPFGNPNNAIALDSPAQGQLLGVQTFNHSGVIDLQANPRAGDVLVITGGQTAGTAGGGVFVSNGGTLKLDTVLNEGGGNSQSDILVVDSTQPGSAPTAVVVNNVGGAGARTVQDGIAVVEVLNKEASAAGVFKLAGRAVAGAYEYFLHQGGEAANGGNPADGNWYLRSEAPLPPPCEETDTCPQPDPTPTPDPAPGPGPVYRPETGAYLGNQAAALGMFRHTLHDRLGEVDFNERQRANGEDDKRGAMWARVVRDQFDTTTGAEQIELGTDSSLLQIGGEFGRWTDGDSRWQVGAMGAIGQANTHVGSNLTGYQAKGNVTGQVLGLYGTWYANASKPTGLYVDSWLQGGRFKNTVEGDYLARERYDAKGWAASVEAGYAFELGRGERSAFYVEPQAQVIVSDYDADDHVEANGTVVKTQQGGGVTTRLGARAYTRPLTDARNRVQPFVEANWWHQSDAPAIDFGGEVQALRLSKNVYELKAGAQMELGGGWTGWGHLGFQRGAGGDDRNVEGLIGVKYGW